MANYILIRTPPDVDSTKLMNAGMYDTTGIIRIQRADTQSGTYADLSGTGSTPTVALVSGTEEYSAYDPSGTSSHWYRSRFENQAGTRTSDWKQARVARYG
jgi:hypothetical protein